MIRCNLLVICVLLPQPAAIAQQTGLPEFGEANAVSLTQEYYLGRAWLMSFRRQAPMLNDAQVQDYIEGLVYRLARDNVMRERIQTRLLHFHNIAQL